MSLEELERQGSFSLSKDGLEDLASSLVVIGRDDLADTVRREIRKQAKSSYDQCAIAMTEMERALQKHSQHLSEPDIQMIAQRLQRAANQVIMIHDGTRRLTQAEVVPKEESRIGAQSKGKMAVEKDGTAQHKRAGIPSCRTYFILRVWKKAYSLAH